MKSIFRAFLVASFSWLKKSRGVKRFLLLVLRFFPALNIRLRRIYLSSMMKEQLPANKWSPEKPGCPHASKGINAKQRTPLEASFSEYREL